jgi:hypothetical protein
MNGNGAGASTVEERREAWRLAKELEILEGRGDLAEKIKAEIAGTESLLRVLHRRGEPRERAMAERWLRDLGVDLDHENSTSGVTVETTSTGYTTGAFTFVRASTVEDRPVEWLIPNTVARGEHNDLCGDPGVGKGGITASWAAQVTRQDPRATVIFLATEDRLSLGKARLRAEGADLDRVLFFDIHAEQVTPALPCDLAPIEALVRDTGAALVTFDPAIEFMEADLDLHRQQDVQRFVSGLSGMAHRTGAAVLTVRHLNKAAGSSAIYRAAGSIAFTGRARMALLAAKDKEHGGRVLTVTKGNVGRDTYAITFDIVERNGSTVVTWGEETFITADELVNQDPRRARGRPAKVDSTRAFLEDLLADGKCMAKTEVVETARAAKAGSRTVVFEVAKAMGLADVTVGGKPGWRLP